VCTPDLVNVVHTRVVDHVLGEGAVREGGRVDWEARERGRRDRHVAQARTAHGRGGDPAPNPQQLVEQRESLGRGRRHQRRGCACFVIELSGFMVIETLWVLSVRTGIGGRSVSTRSNVRRSQPCTPMAIKLVMRRRTASAGLGRMPFFSPWTCCARLVSGTLTPVHTCTYQCRLVSRRANLGGSRSSLSSVGYTSPGRLARAPARAESTTLRTCAVTIRLEAVHVREGHTLTRRSISFDYVTISFVPPHGQLFVPLSMSSCCCGRCG
jgi:hypothetical protein